MCDFFFIFLRDLFKNLIKRIDKKARSRLSFAVLRRAFKERLSMTFVFPASVKNSTSAVCLWRVNTELSRFVFVVIVCFFLYFCERSI